MLPCAAAASVRRTGIGGCAQCVEGRVDDEPSATDERSGPCRTEVLRRSHHLVRGHRTHATSCSMLTNRSQTASDQRPASAVNRPERTASTSAAWSRSVWCEYALAK